ncbi:Dynamin-1-like protein [Tyrophagus putrescentiae]|nr:Dynamin-1-like protein [Tyrophagus putrescentiae]
MSSDKDNFDDFENDFEKENLSSNMQNSLEPLESLVSIINKLQDVFHKVGGGEIKLPEIVVVGSQSSGKSSVLESIVGKDFLPRGAGIVTRCPLILQLQHAKKNDMTIRNEEEGTINLDEWGKFLHSENKVYTDFEDIRQEIIDETERIAGSNKGISSEPINLKIFSNRVVDLTLVDLPGITKVPVGDQPQDIEDQIRELILKYISNDNSIILAVSPANTDFANSESLKLAREVDPDGDRTLAVLTKLDLMDDGTDASDVLSGNVIPVKLGIIGCVNRSQNDINTKKSIDAALQAENSFLQQNYPSLAKQNGTKYLAKKLSALLHSHIGKCLPSLKNRVSDLILKFQEKIEKIGLDITDKRSTVFKILEKFCFDYNSAILGSTKITQKNELESGARICFYLHQNFEKMLSKVELDEIMNEKEILITIRNIQGTSPGLFIPDTVFEQLVQNQIKLLLKPSIICVDTVHDEMQRIIEKCSEETKRSFNRFPNLHKKVCDVVEKLIDKQIEPTKFFVKTLINVEVGYINARHPDFNEAKLMIDNKKDIELKKSNSLTKMKFLNKQIKIDPSDPCYDVSKSIMTLMVNNVKENLQIELVDKIFLPELFDKLLIESEQNSIERRKTLEMLSALKKASQIIFDVKAEQNRYVQTNNL